jgi:predicted porin
MFNQVASVGMSGPFGSVTAGRQIVPMAYAMAETDVRQEQYLGDEQGAREFLS